jgi:hypothetical protein
VLLPIRGALAIRAFFRPSVPRPPVPRPSVPVPLPLRLADIELNPRFPRLQNDAGSSGASHKRTHSTAFGNHKSTNTFTFN